MKKRTVICGQKISFVKGTYWMEVSVPAWKRNEKIAVPITSIPTTVLQTARRFPDNKLRFYAKVNLEAATAQELDIEAFESFDLRAVFQREAVVA